jgi:DNA end-binding protein Ku
MLGGVMPPHALGSATISFGLVSIPVKLYTAAGSRGISFNMLHAKCGSRIRMNYVCPVCNETVDRSATVKGYEFSKGQYVTVTEDELKAVEGEASRMIDIEEFVPLSKVDPIYFENTYYLGPDKGGEKAYRLLSDALGKTDRVALAKFVMRGKESLVLIRAAQEGLLLHTMYFSDEVRDFGEIDKGASAKVRDNELQLAVQLVEGLAADDFKPERYADEYRERLLGMLTQKVEGKEVVTPSPEPARAPVIDLMEALRKSLAARPADVKKPGAKVAARRVAAAAPQKAAEAAGAPPKAAVAAGASQKASATPAPKRAARR